MMDFFNGSRPATTEIFFDSFRQPACINRDNGQFVAVNPAFTAALGWTAEELQGTAYYDLVLPSERRSMIKLGTLIVRHAGSEPRTYRRVFRHKDGGYRLVEWSAWADPQTKLVFATGRALGATEPR